MFLKIVNLGTNLAQVVLKGSHDLKIAMRLKKKIPIKSDAVVDVQGGLAKIIKRQCHA